MRRGSNSLRPIVWLALLPLLIAALTVAFLGLALWELALLLWNLTIRTIRTIRPSPHSAGDMASAGTGDSPPQASDPTPCVPAPRKPVEDSSRLQALLPLPWAPPLPWANLLRAKMAGSAVPAG